MLTLEHILLKAPKTDQVLLNDISFNASRGQFIAIIGASGSGKSTLLKLIAGIYEQQEGSISWDRKDLLTEEDMHPAEVGYIPQFSIAYDFLTVWENVMSAMQLRVRGLSTKERESRTERILQEVGLSGKEDRPVRVLSGGEKRRLALAIEMVGDPVLLLADEVTSGLDPVSEEEIVGLLHDLSRNRGRIVISVTHSLQNLENYDQVIILHAGQMVYAGAPAGLEEYFGIDRPEDVYHRTPQAPPFPQEYIPPLVEAETKEVEHAPAETPSFMAQTVLLLNRRWRIFFRDKTQLFLQIGLIFGFPAVIVLFALDGLPQITSLSMDISTSVMQQLEEAINFTRDSSKAGALVSGLVMFQVVLLTLMASNNSAREVTHERLIFEKEKLAGLRAGSYVTSKLIFLTVLVLAQSAWMTLFVKAICKFPGPILPQLALLVLVNGAITGLSLAVSSFCRTSEQSSLISIYFVGFQLPLSGAVLSLPDVLAVVVRPFIAAYWAWSGYISTMIDTRLYDVVKMVSQTEISPDFLCLWVLASHIVLGIVLTCVGCRQSRWQHV